MARIVRPALFGLLWLAFATTAFATPFRGTDPVAALDSNDQARFEAFLRSQLNKPEQALEDLCRDSGYFLVLPDPTDSEDDSVLDLGDIFSSLGTVEFSPAIPSKSRNPMAGPTSACYHEACETSSLL